MAFGKQSCLHSTCTLIHVEWLSVKNMFTSKKEKEYLHSVGIFTELKLSCVDMYMWSCTNIKIMKNVEYRVTFDTIFKKIIISKIFILK